MISCLVLSHIINTALIADQQKEAAIPSFIKLTKEIPLILTFTYDMSLLFNTTCIFSRKFILNSE
ncbi:MAG: hypothetical protein CMF41_02875 [Legionellales bacterium]|nr:hypothetical protein [Legionellales bacterium]